MLNGNTGVKKTNINDITIEERKATDNPRKIVLNISNSPFSI